MIWVLWIKTFVQISSDVWKGRLGHKENIKRELMTTIEETQTMSLKAIITDSREMQKSFGSTMECMVNEITPPSKKQE